MLDNSSNEVYFVSVEVNWNVMGLVNATNGNISAKYEYGPFGEVFCSVGDMAKVNPFGFSTKYTDNETDLVYYGYRYYSPALGRWLSRDPIEEQGGLNLYGFVNNDPVNAYDTLGLWKEYKKTRKKRRRTYIQENGDTREDLARIVGLDVGEFNDWAKQENAGCAYSVPNIWISADLMRGGDARERFRNLGGTIGKFVGTDLFTHGFHVIKPKTVAELISSLKDSRGDLWGMVVFGHGDREGRLVMSGNFNKEDHGERWIFQRELFPILDRNHYKLSKVYMMQCYSKQNVNDRGVNYDEFNSIKQEEEWIRRTIYFKGYYFLNILGFDVAN